MVAEIVEGETWAWKSFRLGTSEKVSTHEPQWWSVESAAQRIAAYLEVVASPENLDAQWIEEAELQAVGDGPWVVRHVFSRANCSKECGSLQLLQVVYSTPNPDVPMSQINGWSGCVDAGINSVWHKRHGRAPAHPSRPYYYPARIYRGEVTESTIRLVDDVGAAFGHEQIYLEAAGICIGHLGSDRDALLGVLRYGWTEWGDVPTPEPGAQSGPPQEADHVSAMFRAIVSKDYPQYPGPDCWQ
jgi:hypothetical protein